MFKLLLTLTEVKSVKKEKKRKNSSQSRMFIANLHANLYAYKYTYI